MSMHDTNKFNLDELLTPAAASKLLPSTSASTLQRWARQGKLPVVQLPSGRFYFSRADIEAILDPVRLSEDSVDTPDAPGEAGSGSDVPLPGLVGF